MKKSTCAALLSALVFPGSGHFYLKKYWSAGLLFLIAGVASGYIVQVIFEAAWQLSQQIVQGQVVLDETTLLNLLNDVEEKSGATMRTARLVILLCWLFAIVDSYRIGRGVDGQTDDHQQASVQPKQ